MTLLITELGVNLELIIELEYIYFDNNYLHILFLYQFEIVSS